MPDPIDPELFSLITNYERAKIVAKILRRMPPLKGDDNDLREAAIRAVRALRDRLRDRIGGL